MIYHDRSLNQPLPARQLIFGVEGALMLAGALIGIEIEGHLPALAGLGVAGALLLLYLPRARRLAVMRSARYWHAGLLAALLVAIILETTGSETPRWLLVAAPFAIGEVGAIAATDAPWPRTLAGWRPTFRVSLRLFGLIAAAALLGSPDFVAMAHGSLVAVTLALMTLPIWVRRPDVITVEGRETPARNARCPRCGVPGQWPVEGPGSCVACGLILRAGPPQSPSD